MAKKRNPWIDRTQDAAIRSVLGLARTIPYRRRVPLVGWVVSRIVAPLAGWRTRISDNLAMVRPDLSPEEVTRLRRDVPDNLGRSLIEIYSGAEFRSRMAEAKITGPGVAPFEAARRAGRPVILVTGHIGNFDAVRATMFAQGHPLAGLYRPMHNPSFNDHYVRALASIGEPVFPTTRPGILAFVRHLAEGGIVGILVDVYTDKGAPLTFFGKLAPTALSAAEWAVRFDALLVPVYGIRRPDGLGFDVTLDAPVPHGDPRVMTQSLNDGIERQARRHMGQYLWTHQRWKRRFERQFKRAAARMGP